MIEKLSWEKGQKYYRLARIQTLFSDDLAIQLVWGRKGTKLGNQRTIFCDNMYEVYQVIEATRKARKKRGYALISEE